MTGARGLGMVLGDRQSGPSVAIGTDTLHRHTQAKDPGPTSQSRGPFTKQENQ